MAVLLVSMAHGLLGGIARAQANGIRFGRPRSGFDYKRALHLKAEGWSVRKIAKEVGVSPSSIQRLVKRRVFACASGGEGLG